MQILPPFALTAFGSAPATGTSLFGQATPTSSTSLFSTPTSTATGLFGGGIGSGTTVKFEPLIGNDSIVRNGISSNTSTKHQCISAMKQYEGKSVEELRVEDYLANRKGSTMQTGGLSFATSSAAPVTGSVFNTTPASSASFLSQNKPIFGIFFLREKTVAAPSSCADEMYIIPICSPDMQICSNSREQINREL
ncbi:unnamed protein product, partial [Soboliphyme baturini]|uniref:Nuclear pore complex protein Nup98-Nup96 n=1 Tax=Soboliphyme baturini TaxID=241478 RepID=A0A183I9P4_9BILA